MDQEDVKTTCMACSCPCEMHKEHNHPAEGGPQAGAEACQMCGHEHRAGGSCDCGCK